MKFSDHLLGAALTLLAAGCWKPAPPSPVAAAPLPAQTGIRAGTGTPLDASNPEVASILATFGLAKQAFDEKRYDDLFNLSPPSMRLRLLNGTLLRAKEVASARGQGSAFRELLDSVGLRAELVHTPLGPDRVWEERMYERHWLHVQDRASEFRTLRNWLDNYGEAPARFRSWFSGVPQVQELSERSAKALIQLPRGSAATDQVLCEFAKEGGRWYMVLGNRDTSYLDDP